MLGEKGKRVFEHVSLPDLPLVAKELLTNSRGCFVWLFRGEMGAGKTTLIKAICAELGVNDSMSSPTFSIVNEYHTKDGGRVFHFDFYRLKNEREALDIGVDEYFYSGDPCFIEWPEKIPSLIPADHVQIEIESENQTYRTISLSVHDGKEENRV